PVAYRRAERAVGRPLPNCARGQARCQFRLGRRCRRTGLGHQSRRWWHVYFATMRKHKPDFLLHSGDTIYADGIISGEVKLPDGKVWKNVTIPEKAKVAETLDEFRAAHKYNF